MSLMRFSRKGEDEMADFEIKSPPVFVQELRKLEPTDRGHADVFNAIFSVLLNNEAYLKAVEEELKLTSGSHADDSGIHVTAEDKQAWNADATQTSSGRMSAEDKKKLDNVAAGAEANQNAYAKVVAGSVTVEANGKTSTLNLVAGSNVTITGDNANKRITIGVELPAAMPPSAHNQSASTITAGTMAGRVLANASAAAAVGNKQVRNIYAGTSDMTAGVTALSSGDIYVMYE